LSQAGEDGSEAKIHFAMAQVEVKRHRPDMTTIAQPLNFRRGPEIEIRQ
jgi:hypothetical protein